MRRLLVVLALGLGAFVAVAWAGPDDDDGEEAEEEEAAEADDADAGVDDELPAPASFDRSVTRPRGFDHVAHDGKVTVTGQASIACTACHALDKKGKVRGVPGHATCYGACHGAPPVKPAKKSKLPAPYELDEVRAKVCLACHAPSALGALVAGEARTASAYPPGPVEPDYGLAMSHAGHDAATPCLTCHDADGRKASGSSHARCTACHLAPAADVVGLLPLSDCAGCHTPEGEARPELDHGALLVTGAFSHAGHAKKSTAECRSCHGAVASATGAELAGPGPADCRGAGCHDGTAAFATTDACTRCHSTAPTTTYELERPQLRFSHARHRTRLTDGDCRACHALDGRGEAPAPPHSSCASAACHQTDFEVRAPKVCGACHVAIEPWRALEADALPRVETEFGAVMPHRQHADLGRTCASCHQLDNGRRQLRPPRGHTSCTGEGCHVATGGPTPTLTECGSCHRAGLVSDQVGVRSDAAWSVRDRFVHDRHVVDGSGAAIACEACHDLVWRTDRLPDPPAKASCAGCHDGTAAFKMTGHGCARCHGSENP